MHAATPGHGKTIAAAYIVGARGRPRDAVILGIFVTLSHTSGIVLVGLLASLGSAELVPQRIEAWLALVTGALVVVLGLWTLWTQREMIGPALRGEGATGTSFLPVHTHGAVGDAQVSAHGHSHASPHEHAHHQGHTHPHGHEHSHDHAHSHEHAHTGQDHTDAHGHGHSHDHAHDHSHGSDGDMGWHSHGWGVKHSHALPDLNTNRMSIWMLVGLGIAGGLLPDPAALAMLLSALAKGNVMLGLGTVLVFSIGFAATLVVVGVVAAQVGRRVLDWLSGPWAVRIQVGTSALIVLVGVWLTWGALQTLRALQ